MTDLLYRLLRNEGCRIVDDIDYKGYRSLLLENEKLLIHLLLDKGAEPIRWLHKPTDTDFIWISGQGLVRANALYSDYQSSYLGGWQEMLPEVSCTSQYRGATVHRGESAVTPWDYRIIKDDPNEIQVVLINCIRSLPFRVEKRITLTSGSGKVRIEETLYNLSPTTSLEANWGHHLAFGAPFISQEAVISLGEGTQICDPVSGESWEWPFMIKDGAAVDLSIMPAPGTVRDLLFIKMAAYQYRLTNPLKEVALEVRWDGKIWPYLWYWQNFMADHDAPFFGRDYNIGLEMFNVPPKLTLSEAVEQGYALEVPAGGSISSWLEIEAIPVAKSSMQSENLKLSSV